MTASITKPPAATPTPAPMRIFLTFAPISAFASSISSRISSVACSEISVIAAAMFAGASSCSVSAAKAPQQERRDQPAGERRADQQLGPRAGELEAQRRLGVSARLLDALIGAGAVGRRLV